MPDVPPRGNASRRALGNGPYLCVLIDLALRELRQRLVGFLFLGKGCLQQLHGLVEAELRRPGWESGT
jgi:hypothetical protein